MFDIVGSIPYRLALAGGWIDQPFVSGLNPTPPGSMVTVNVEPRNWFMERSGMATGTRRAARQLWGKTGIPDGDAATLVKDLYKAENEGKTEPSGSQDMIGLIYKGVCRLDYDASHEGGYFPVHIEQCVDPEVAAWVGNVVQLLPVAPRPAGYHPLGEQHLNADWVRNLGDTGKACFDAIMKRNVTALGESMNRCMACWEALLPNTVRHEVLQVDLKAVLGHYQSRYPGAMYSGCGGGYLYIVAEDTVPGTFRVTVRS